MVGPDKMTAAEYRKRYVDNPGRAIEGNSPKPNRKVRGATKTERDGVAFDSMLERYMYDLLTLHKIQFKFQVTYELQPGFRYNGQAVRPITYTIDFRLPEFDMIVDTKGHATQQGKLRIKMLKKQFHDEGRQTRIELPKDRDACASLVRRLMEERNARE